MRGRDGKNLHAWGDALSLGAACCANAVRCAGAFRAADTVRLASAARCIGAFRAFAVLAAVVVVTWALALSSALALADEVGEAAGAQSDAAATSAAASASAASAEAPAVVTLDDMEDNLVDPTQRADNSFIYDTTVESLFEESTLYDNRVVQVEGEVIGDCIGDERNPARCWITLTATDEEVQSTISVLMSMELAGQIDAYGRYGVTGTMLQVRGEYHQACPDHDGLADIHATNASVIARGVEHPDDFALDDFIPGIVTVLIGLALMGAFYYARERTR